MAHEVAIGFLADQTVDAQFVSSLLAVLAQRPTQTKGRVIQVQGFAGRLDIGRHYVAQIFLDQTTADYLLMVDSDMVFTVEDFDTIIKDVTSVEEPALISGLYVRENGSMCAFDLVDGKLQPVDPTNLVHSRWYDPASVGLGFTAVRRDLLQNLRELDEDNPMPWFNSAQEGWPGVRMADDSSFCYNVTAAGYKLTLDTDIKVGHLKSVTMMPKLESALVTPEKGLVVP